MIIQISPFIFYTLISIIFFGIVSLTLVLRQLMKSHLELISSYQNAMSQIQDYFNNNNETLTQVCEFINDCGNTIDTSDIVNTLDLKPKGQKRKLIEEDIIKKWNPNKYSQDHASPLIMMDYGNDDSSEIEEPKDN